MFELPGDKSVSLSVQFLDSRGNPAEVDGVPNWFIDNPNVATIAPAADGLSCLVTPAGPLGDAMVSIKADADLGEGVINLVGTFELTVTAGQATQVVITPGPLQLTQRKSGNR